jgi:PAS domain S-box-containing protein
MRHRRRAWIFGAAVAVCAVAALLMFERHAQVRTLRVGAQSYYPYIDFDSQGKPFGMVADILEEAAHRKSLRLQWVKTTEGVEASLGKGIVDLWPAAAVTSDRSRQFYITRPWLRNDFCLVSEAGKNLRTPNDCRGRVLGFVDGPITRQLVKQCFPGVIEKQVNSRVGGVLAACRGEVDATFVEMRLVQSLLLERPPECQAFHFELHPIPKAAIKLGIGAPFRYAALADSLRSEIDNLRADGTFEKALSYWNPISTSEMEVLFAEQERRHRTVLFLWGLSAMLLLALLLLWQNRRVSRAKHATDVANSALEATVSQIRDAHQRLRFQVDRMPLAYIVWDKSFRVREWNPAAESIFGWTASEAIGMHFSELLAPAEDSSHVDEIWEDLLRGEKETYSVDRNIDKHGRKLYCEWFSSPLRNEAGQIVGALSMVHDITERKRMEEERSKLQEQFLQSQKLESIGRLAGGVAHDFNNLLTVINGYGDLVLDQLPEQDPVRVPVEHMRKAGERAATLTQELLAFSRKQIMQLKPLDLNAVVKDHEELLRRLLTEDVELKTRLAPSLGQVMADATQMHQILMNLVVNARDAMPNGGTVLIETANAEVDANEAATNPEAIPGSYVMVSIADTGLGMDAKTQQHIFEPFFTTKAKGVGTGLGLSTVHGIVRQNGGWIRVSSAPGAGSTFNIYLPRIPDAPRAVEAPEPVAVSLRGVETVLVVEDESELRNLAVELLTKQGYHVLSAVDGADAIQVAEAHTGPIHLMLTDVMMPGITGRALADRLKSSRPEMKVLYMSGYAEDVIARRGLIESGVELVPKPFTPASLAAKVRAVLGPA